jgi:hypothetical protein
VKPIPSSPINIVMKPHSVRVSHDGQSSMIVDTRICQRQAEILLSRRGHQTKLSTLEQRILALEQIGMRPQDYPNEQSRPGRALFGSPLHSWIGKRCGLSGQQVRKKLERIEMLERAQAQRE